MNDSIIITGRDSGVVRLAVSDLRNEDEDDVPTVAHPGIATAPCPERVWNNDKAYILRIREVSNKEL